jgi:hypothetical protein
MLTIDVNGTRTCFCVGGIPGILMDKLSRPEKQWGWDLQPINNLGVRKTEDKLVNNAVDTHRSTNKVKIRVRWIVEYEVVTVEGR